MSSKTKGEDYIGDGMTPVTPYLTIEACADAADWYKKVFGAEEVMRMGSPDGKVMHMEMSIGGARFMMSDAFPDWGVHGPKGIGGTCVGVHLYVPDTDAVFEKAIKEGARSIQDPNDAFWGDRFSKIEDPFGHQWSIATKQRDMTPVEIDKAQAAWFAEQGAGSA